ncbi:unnamed protein product [Ixodes hexagonus]
MARSAHFLTRHPTHGIDSSRSWVILAFCCLVLFMSQLSIRVAGILYYGIIETFSASRQEASWPITLLVCLFNLAGPLMGFLCRRYSCRAVLLTSSLSTGVTMSLCFLAPNVLFLSVVLGILHGACLCGTFVGVNVILAQHFEKRRTTAFSLLFTISNLSFLFFPYVAEFFRSDYGCHGTFLLLGGIMLNAFPGSLALRSPPWITEQPLHPGNSVAVIVEGAATVHQNGPHMTSCHIGSKEDRSRMNDNQEPTGATHLHDYAEQEPLKLPENENCKDLKLEPEKATISVTLKNFAAPLFWIDALSFSACIFGMTTFLLLLVDLSTERGVRPIEAVYLFLPFAIADMIVRTFSGSAIDSGIISMDTAMLIGCITEAMSFQCIVWSESYTGLLIGSLLEGVSNGLRLALQAPVMVKDFGVEHLPLMIGGLTFVIGLVLLARPPLIGYYRDYHGTYDGLLHIITAVNVLLTVAWLARIVSERCRLKKERNCVVLDDIYSENRNHINKKMSMI